MNRIIPLIILLVVGCATQTAYTPTYQTSLILDTNPKGATVVCDGQDWGYTPQVGSIKNIDFVGENRALTDEEIIKITQGEYTDKDFFNNIGDVECIAYWSSGVSKKYPFKTFYTYIGKGNFIYTLQRPEGAGYSQDAEFALKVQQLKQDQNNANRNASIAISAVQAQQRAAQAQERAAVAQAFQSIKSTTCTTTLGITRCY